MEIYCSEAFYKTYRKLIKNNSYSNLPSCLAEAIKVLQTLEGIAIKLKLTTILDVSKNEEVIKFRLGGRSGYRVIALHTDLVSPAKIFLGDVFPKRGSMGRDNITTAEKTEIYNEIIRSEKEKTHYRISFDESDNLQFTQESVNEEELTPDFIEEVNPNELGESITQQSGLRNHDNSGQNPN